MDATCTELRLHARYGHNVWAVVVGRRGWLFAGSDSGGDRAAAFYSLLNTAKLNGIDPYRYLSYVMANIAEHPINRIDELLPWNVADNINTSTV